MLMDEPFSAVDPVVREQLQNEFLRLQGELGKTIVFVTHDIDEAIKLGDQVAVLRVGGTLAQMATPAELLARPADPFVAGFVGRDRGYRALGFTTAGAARPRSRPRPSSSAPTSRPRRAARPTAGSWWSMTPTRRRAGWPPSELARRPAERSITPDLLNLGGTLAREGGTLREVLDAALSSPSGWGVVVDAAGRLAGTITAEQVLAQINGAQRSRDGGRDAMSDAALGLLHRPSVSDIRQLDLDHHLARRAAALIGTVIALPIGWWASRYRWLYLPLVTTAGILYTIPSIVLFVSMPGMIGTKILDPHQRRHRPHRLHVRPDGAGQSPTASARCPARPWRPPRPWASRPAATVRCPAADRGAGASAPACGSRRCPT